MIDSLVAAVPKVEADTSKALLLILIGYRRYANEPDSGVKYASQGLSIAQRIRWNKGIAYAYNTLGVCAVSRSNYAKGLDYYNRALKIFEEEKDKQGMLKVIGNIGNIYTYQSDYPQALGHDFLALKYAEELRDTVSIITNFMNIGSAYEYLKDYDKGLKYDFMALNMLRRKPDSEDIALIFGNIGNLYSDKGMDEEGLHYQQQALAVHERLGNKDGIIRDLLNLGEVYSDTHLYSKALTTFFQALDLVRKHDLRMLESTLLASVGQTYISMVTDSGAKGAGSIVPPRIANQYAIPADKRGRLLEAISYLQQSIRIDSALNNPYDLLSSYRLLADAQKLAGYPAAALESKERFFAIKDSVFSLESKVKISNLETKRELELKDKQIEIDRLAVAKKRNERVFFIIGIALLLMVGGIIFRNIRLQNAKQLSEGKLSAFQARMNPHFIFNSLNSIQSLVLNNDTIGSITYLSQFSKLMRQILDSSAQSKVMLSTELQMLRGYIELEQLRFDRFSYEINVSPGISPDGIEVPAMLIQPFVENAIIHGILPKKGEGRLTLSFEKADGHLACTIDDNGIGRKASAVLNAARRKDHESHGISIASNRLALLSKSTKGSVIYIDKEEGGIATGTTVILQIPIL